MKTDSSRRLWSFLALSGTLSASACGDAKVPLDVSATDPLVAAALQAGDGNCVPEAIFRDGLGGFNPLASDPRFSTLDECGPPPTEDPYPDSAGIWIYGWELNECFNISWDIDNDGVHNGCENAVAAAFAPDMIFTTRCDWDAAFSRMGGEYYFAVQRAKTQVYGSLRIAYLPAYYWDCGGIHEICQFPFVSCGGHPGDSEFILVDITYDFGTQHWKTDQVFLSAHCGTSTNNNCRWWPVWVFEWFDNRDQGAPVVWVAESKKANYYSQEHCDSGASVFGFDTCDFYNAFHRFPVVYVQQNIGSRQTPLRDCATSFSGSPMTDNVIECMWSQPPSQFFKGWQNVPVGEARPYGSILSQYARF